MKKLTVVLSILMSIMFICAGNAGAVSYSYLLDYWTPTDDSFHFLIKLEEASYESEFGLFAFEDPDNRITIFEKNDEQWSEQSVYFRNEGGWQVSLNNIDWTDFVDNFGFYYGVYTGGRSDSSMDYLWFTDTRYNQYAARNSDGSVRFVDTNIEHVRILYGGMDSDWLVIQLDDQLRGGDRDWNDMTIKAYDLQPAPVPEPTTMLLLGSGLVGLAGVGRKKMFKK